MFPESLDFFHYHLKTIACSRVVTFLLLLFVESYFLNNSDMLVLVIYQLILLKMSVLVWL